MDFIIHEIDSEAIKKYSGESDYHLNIDLSEELLGVCWSLKALEICIQSVSATKAVLIVKLLGKEVATVTLKKDKSCVKVKEHIGGDTARVDASICADFDEKEIRAKGKICAAFVCTKFNQRILKW